MKQIKQVKKEKNEKRKRSLIGQIILAILIIIILLLSFRCGRGDAPATAEYEQNVNAITEIDYSERQEAIDAIVEEGKMNVNYSPKAVFDGKTSVLFNIKNIKNNRAPIVFEIFDEDNNSIYQSKMIAQGYEMNCIELKTELEKGTHDCTIKVRYADAGNVVAAFPITIEVK